MELGSYATLFNDSMSATRYEIMQRYVNSEDKFARWRGKDKRMWHSLFRERVRNDRETLVTGLEPSADPGRGGGGCNRYKLPAPGHPEGGLEPDYVAHVFGLLGSIIICLLYKLTFSDQA
jgi:hypothetical protein